MLPNELPEIIDPFKYCRQNQGAGTHLSGSMCVSKIADVLQDSHLLVNKIIQIELNFFYSMDEVHVIEGQVSGTLRLNCQRCLDEFHLTVSPKIKVAVVKNLETAKKLPSQYEPLIAETGKVNLRNWMAEEILLAIPMIPKHEEPCGMIAQFNHQHATVKPSEKVLPFADLHKKLLSREVES